LNNFHKIVKKNKVNNTLKIFLVFAIFLVQNVFCRVLEVKPNSKIFFTIQSAINFAVAGDTVLVYAGIYNESLTFPNSGIINKPIVVLAIPGDKVILDGSVVLNGWQKCASTNDISGNNNWNKIYFTDAPDSSNRISINLFQNKQRLFIAQTPEAGNPFYDENTRELFNTPTDLNSYTHSSIIDKNILTQTEDDFWNTSYLKIVSGNNKVFIKKIIEYSASEHKIVFESLNADVI